MTISFNGRVYQQTIPDSRYHNCCLARAPLGLVDNRMHFARAQSNLGTKAGKMDPPKAAVLGLMMILLSWSRGLAAPTAKTRGQQGSRSTKAERYNYQLLPDPTTHGGSNSGVAPAKVVTSNRHRRATEAADPAFLDQAAKYLSAEEMERFDAADPVSVKEMRRLVDQRQAENANFSFGYSIQDGINDGFIERTEERSGLSLEGQYSYSDGYFMHTVRYVADEKGYRVTGMESAPVGAGPREDRTGSAVVQQVVSGVETHYAIRAAPVEQSEDGDAQGRGNVYVEMETNFDEEGEARQQ